MKYFSNSILSSLILIVLITQGLFAAENKLVCTTDVSIIEGSSIAFCQGEFVTLNATSGFVSYAWTGPQTGSAPSIAPTISGQFVVTAVDGIGCISSDTIDVLIHPNPTAIITSSEGNFLCPGSSGSILSLSQTFATYLWNNGANSSTIQITQGGNFSVVFEDLNGCIGNASLVISQPNFTLSPMGSGTVCNGSAETLVASGGTSYVWSTTETGTTIVVAPLVTTIYSVTITNGTCTTTLSQTVTVEEMPDTTVTHAFFIAEGDRVFINGPDGYTSYSWTPQIDLTSYNKQGATFLGNQSIGYTVNSSHTNGCVRNDYVEIIVVRLTIPTGFSPNGDLINDTFEVPELALYKAKVAIFNRWGDKVFESKHYQNDWNGTCQTAFCAGQGDLPEGTYFYSIDVENVRFDGYTTIKR